MSLRPIEGLTFKQFYEQASNIKDTLSETALRTLLSKFEIQQEEHGYYPFTEVSQVLLWLESPGVFRSIKQFRSYLLTEHGTKTLEQRTQQLISATQSERAEQPILTVTTDTADSDSGSV